MVRYDEFGMFRDNAAEAGIPWKGQPAVERRDVAVPGGRTVSSLVWGSAEPEVVLVHGGAQNAHTWDTVALALDLPILAVDLPGHGHSEWKPDHDYRPESLAADLASVMGVLAPRPRMVVGMSLGGLTCMCLAAEHPELVPRLAVVDVTPGTDHAKAEPIIAFISGPERFASFDEIMARTVEHNPTRTVSSLRRGVLHNALEQPDGSWTWRYDRMREWARADARSGGAPDFSSIWASVERLRMPLLLVRGGLSGVVGDEDVSELRRRKPDAEVVVVEGAGHSVQGDRPVELAAILREFLERP
jgi:pimeloyl-ACP methyl ester carboxylesterase